MWPQERHAGHQTIHINPMQWIFSGMEGVYPFLVQWSWKYALSFEHSEHSGNTLTAGQEWTPSFQYL